MMLSWDTVEWHSLFAGLFVQIAYREGSGDVYRNIEFLAFTSILIRLLNDKLQLQ